MADANENVRISLSEARLDAALKGMELRLRVYFDEQLKNKANETAVLKLAAQVDALDRGDFTDVHRRALTEFIEDHQTEREGVNWTRKERRFGAIALFISLVAVIASIYFGLDTAGEADNAQRQGFPVAWEVTTHAR